MPKLPLDEAVEWLVDFLQERVDFLFDGVAVLIGGIVELLAEALQYPPAWLIAAVLAALALRLAGWPLAVFSLLGLLLIDNLGYWEQTMDTLALVLTSSILSVVIGVPAGIACARSGRVQAVVTPLLDFMQTMPAFVYLIPAVTFFGLGVVPGVIASVIFAIAPTIRLTNLGIRQVPAELIEASEAFGSTPGQQLFKVQLPLATPSIMAGVNQTIMLSLSMVVIASLIGAQGIGAVVYGAVSQIKTGRGFEAGLAIVILAIVLDRLTQNWVRNNPRAKGEKAK